jgi:hypothetical protein
MSDHRPIGYKIPVKSENMGKKVIVPQALKEVQKANFTNQKKAP